MDTIWEAIRMHLQRHKSKYRFAITMVSIAVGIIFFSFAIITPPPEEIADKYTGAINTFDDNGTPAIACAVNYPASRNPSKKSIFSILDPFGVDYSGFPIWYDNQLIENTAVCDHNGMKIICIVEKGDNRFLVHLYDIYGGEFTDKWPLLIDASYCSLPKIEELNDEHTILFHTDNNVYAVNPYGESLSNFPVTIDGVLNSGIEVINNKIVVATDNGKFYFIDPEGNVETLETEQPSEQEILRNNGKVIRAYPEGFQVIEPGNFVNRQVPEGIHEIRQPLAPIDNNLCLITADKDLTVYDLSGNKNPDFSPISGFSDIYMPPVIKDTEVIIGGSIGFNNWRMNGFQYPSGHSTFDFNLSSGIYSNPRLEDINRDEIKDIVFLCSDGKISYYGQELDELYQIPEYVSIYIPDKKLLEPWQGMGKSDYTVKFSKEVYEQTKDLSPAGVWGWEIYDGTGTITWDSPEEAVCLKGNAQSTGYRCRDQTGANAYKDWDEKIFRGIGFSLKYSESFTAYISCDTQKGHRYIYYTPIETDEGTSGQYIHYGLGGDAVDGNWHRFYRNLEEDLQHFEPDNNIIEVNAFLIKGSGCVRNIFLFDASKTPHDSVTDMKKIKTKTEIRYDEKGNIIEKIIRGEDDHVIRMERYVYEYHPNGSLKRKVTIYYAGETPNYQLVYIYNEQGQTIEYLYQLLNTLGEPVYTSRTLYYPESTDNEGNKLRDTTLIVYYHSPDGGLKYQEQRSIYKENKLLRIEYKDYECLPDKGPLLTTQSNEYFYEDARDANRTTKIASTFSDTEGNILKKQIIEYLYNDTAKLARQIITNLDSTSEILNRYTYEYEYDIKGRLIRLTVAIETAGFVSNKYEYLYIYGNENRKYIYTYSDALGPYAVYEIVNDLKGKTIQAIYKYPRSNLIYKYTDYKYDAYKKPISVKAQIQRPGIGSTSIDYYYFYDIYGNYHGNYRSTLSIEEDKASISGYLYDELRRFKGYIGLSMPKEIARGILDKGGDVELDMIPGLYKYIYNIVSQKMGRILELEYRYFAFDEIWKQTGTYKITYNYNKGGLYESILYQWLDKNGVKTAQYEYLYDKFVRLTSAIYRYYYKSGFNYARYENLYTYSRGLLEKIVTSAFRGKDKASECVITSAYDNNGNTSKVSQFVIDPETGKAIGLYEIHYFYGSQLKRYVQLFYKVMGDFYKGDILNKTPDLELQNIYETRYLKWDVITGRAKRYMSLTWDPSFKDGVLAGELNKNEASSLTYTYYNFDSFGRWISIVWENYWKKKKIYSRGTYSYDLKTGIPKEYKSENLLNNELIYEYTLKYLYEDDRCVGYDIVWQYKDGAKNYYENHYTYDEIGFITGATVRYSRDIEGEKTLINKREDTYTKDPETGNSIEDIYKYYIPKDKELLYTGKYVVGDYKWKNGRIVKSTNRFFDYNDKLQSIVDWEGTFDGLGRPMAYTYLCRFPDNPNKNYLMMYKYTFDPKSYRVKEVIGSYLRPDTKEEFYKWICPYNYTDSGILKNYKYYYVYPDGSSPWEYLYEYHYDKFERFEKLIGKYYRNGKQYGEYAYNYDPKTGLWTGGVYWYVNINKLWEYYDIKYDKSNICKSYKFRNYINSISPGNITGSGEYLYNYNDRQELESIELRQFDRNGNLLLTYRYKYNPNDRVYLGYEAVNHQTGGKVSFNIREHQWNAYKSVEKIVQNSPTEIHTINYILDQYGRTTGINIFVKNSNGLLIRIEEKRYNPEDYKLIGWNNKFLTADGITVKEERICNNITYLNEFYIGTEIVDVHIHNPGNYTMTVEHVYNNLLQHVANKVTTSDGRSWTEYLDSATGNALYKIDQDTGGRTEGGTSSGSTAIDTSTATDAPAAGGAEPSVFPAMEDNSLERQLNKQLEARIGEEKELSQINEKDITNPQNIYAAGSVYILDEPIPEEIKKEAITEEEAPAEGKLLPGTGVSHSRARTSSGMARAEAGGAAKETAKEAYPGEEYPGEFIEEEIFEEPVEEYAQEIQLQQRYEERKMPQVYKRYEPQIRKEEEDWRFEFLKGLLNKLLSWVRKKWGQATFFLIK